MQKNKENNFLGKLVKKNYKNELETVLEDKFFDENAKGLLLEILYKIETAYKDYSKVKIDSQTKEEYLENFIRIIKEECKTIKIVKPNSEQAKLLDGRTFKVNKEKKEIICQPIARKLLYSVSKISKRDKIVKEKYFLLSKTLSNTINVGNSINTVEPLRDFNGWSWTTVPREIESIDYNLIYQTIEILIGATFLETWVKDKEYLIDYLEELKNRLEAIYGEKLTKDFLDELNKLSVLMEIKIDKQVAEEIQQQKNELEEKVAKFNSKQTYVKELTEEKNVLKEQIKQIDTIINNKDMLQQEYIKRNEELPLEKKIFSMRVLAEMFIKEREELLEKMEEVNDLLKPQNFIEKKAELEQRLEYLNLASVDDEKVVLEEAMLTFQKIFLECFKEKIKRAETKQEIINLIYQFRYYCLLPYDQNTNVANVKQIQKDLDKTGKILINKAIENKVIVEFSSNEDLNYEIVKNIFYVRIITLEESYMKLTKEKENYFIQFFDENIFEEKRNLKFPNLLTKKDFEVKLNRKIKLFL